MVGNTVDPPPMPTDYYGAKVVKLQNDAVAPEVMERCGSVHLHFGYDDDRETIELEGSLTMSEVCFLKERLSTWIHDKLKKMEENV